MHTDIPDIPDTHVTKTPSLPMQISAAARESGLQLAKSEGLVAVFRPYANRALEVIVAADAVKEGDVLAAKETRVALKKVRCAVETLRKQEKADSLKLGRAVDSIAGVIFNVIQPVESRMESIEKAEEIAAQKAKLERANQRRAQLAEVGGIVPDAFLMMEMDDASFEAMLAGARLAKEKRLAEEAKAIEEAKQREEARLAEEARLREENERLAKVAKEAEAKRIAAEAEARKERERLEAEASKQRAAAAAAAAKAEAEARKEREAREALERAERERQEALAAHAKKEAQAAAKAARAPDRVKLLELVNQFEAISYPTMKTDNGREVLEAFKAVVTEGVAMLRKLTDNL